MQKFTKQIAVLLLFAALTGCTIQHKQPVEPEEAVVLAPPLTERDEKWIEDINFVKETMYAKHPNPFYSTSKEEFDLYFNKLIDDVPNLEEHVILVELQKIIAKAKDGHMKLDLVSHFLRACPYLFEQYQGELYAIAHSTLEPEWAQGLYQKLVQINGVDIKYIESKLSELWSTDGSAYWQYSDVGIPKLLAMPYVLDAIGVPNTEKYMDYTFADETGQLLTTRLDLVRIDKYNTAEQNTAPAWAGERVSFYAMPTNNKPYEYRYLAEENAIYLIYQQCKDDEEQPFVDFVEKLFQVVQDNQVQKIIVDLRANKGGNSSVINPLFNKLVQWPKFQDTPNQLIVLIGKNTFSAGVDAVQNLSRLSCATVAGSPTGGDIASFGNIEIVTLPNCKASFIYTTKYFSGGKKISETGTVPKHYNAYLPDVYIENTIESYKQGRDLVLEWALEQ